MIDYYNVMNIQGINLSKSASNILININTVKQPSNPLS